MPRVVTVGGLDITTEGLLLLTNDGALARALALPSTGLQRTYRVRAKGTVTPQKIEELASGITVEGVHYQPITAVMDREMGANTWLTVTLTEGKKREVRRALEAVNLIVNRLIRISYGPFELIDLKPGQVDEIPPNLLSQAIGDVYGGAKLAEGAPMPASRPGAKAGPKRAPRPGSGPAQKSGAKPFNKPDPRLGPKSGPKTASRSAPKSRANKGSKKDEEWTTSPDRPAPKSRLGSRSPSGKVPPSRKRTKPR